MNVALLQRIIIAGIASTGLFLGSTAFAEPVSGVEGQQIKVARINIEGTPATSDGKARITIVGRGKACDAANPAAGLICATLRLDITQGDTCNDTRNKLKTALEGACGATVIHAIKDSEEGNCDLQIVGFGGGSNFDVCADGDTAGLTRILFNANQQGGGAGLVGGSQIISGTFKLKQTVPSLGTWGMSAFLLSLVSMGVFGLRRSRVLE